MFPTDHFGTRTSLRRAELVEVDDSGEHQLATALGYDEERFTKIHRIQPFGMTSVPPKGAHGLVGLVNGRLDQAVLLGIEHQSHRPKNTPAGCTILYNAHGDAVSIVQQNIRIVSARIDLN